MTRCEFEHGVKWPARGGAHGVRLGPPRVVVALKAGLTAAALAMPCLAEAEADARRIETAEAFSGLVAGRELTRLGVTLQVDPDGQISGRALGRTVEGRWEWRDGYFCRDFNGRGLLGYDCQTVELRQGRLRFRAARGTGDMLELRLR